MANEFLSLDQVCEALSASQADVKAMVADGRLHEFRDAGKVFFKRSEIERMAAKEGSSIVDLAAADEVAVDDSPDENASFASALSSLADSSSSLGLGELGPPGAAIPPDQPSELNLLDEPSSTALTDSGSSLGISPLEMKADDFPKDLPAAPKDGGKELTSEIDLLPSGDEEEIKPAATAPAFLAAEVPDLGLSGSSIISLEPGDDSAITPPPKPAAPTGKGISVFEDEEVEIAADPMGETRISAGVDELEAVGSGSGLLDLTQVSDDTSLGAELLDVISPTAAGETEAESAEPIVEAAETVEDAGVIVAEAVPETPTVSRSAPVAAVASRPTISVTSEVPGAMWINLTALLGVVGMIIVGLVTASALQGVWPGFMTPLAKDVIHYSVFGGLTVLAIIFGVVGIMAK